jgi:hypothetical protein
VPALSPCIVESPERLVRYLTPKHIEDAPEGHKLVMPSAFSHAGTLGMSVDRCKYRSAARLDEVSKQYVGYVTATCGAIREICADGARCFAVYDTSLVENVAHADVCQVCFAPKSKQAEYRRRLRAVFDKDPIFFKGSVPLAGASLFLHD